MNVVILLTLHYGYCFLPLFKEILPHPDFFNLFLSSVSQETESTRGLKAADSA